MIALLSLWISTAGAHAGAESTTLSAEPPFALETSFGLLFQDASSPSDDPSYGWVCHEAITQPKALLTPRYAASPTSATSPDVSGQTWLAVVADLGQSRDKDRGVYRSNGLCSWTSVADLAGLSVADIAFVDAQVAVAVTASLDPTGVSTLWRSADAGLTWTQQHAAPAGQPMTRVVHDGSNVWSVSFDPLAVGATVHHSADAGLTWTSTALDLTAYEAELTGGVAVEALAADQGKAWLNVRAPTGHRLLRTDSPGGPWVEALAVDNTLADVAIGADGTIWALELIRAVWHKPPGATTFTPLDDVPPGNGLFAPAADGSSVAMATSAALTGALAYTISASGEATVRTPTAQVQGPLSCPPDSDQARVCDDLWQLVTLPQPGNNLDTGLGLDPNLDPTRKACQHVAPPGLGGLGLAMGLSLLVIRRRREAACSD